MMEDVLFQNNVYYWIIITDDSVTTLKIVFCICCVACKCLLGYTIKFFLDYITS